LSDGRLILGVGVGDPLDFTYAAFGEETDVRVRAGIVDEALEVLDRRGLPQPSTAAPGGPLRRSAEAGANWFSEWIPPGEPATMRAIITDGPTRIGAD
jgi:hypothetical protein